MISYVTYKVIHYLGIFALVAALAAALGRGALVADPREGNTRAPDPWGKRLGILHGVALFLILLGGFGMLARLGIGIQGWTWGKIAIWVALGGLIAFRKSAAWSPRALLLLPVLAFLAGYLAFVKPF